MKKIVVFFDGTHLPGGAFACVKNIHASQPVLVMGIFVSSGDESDLGEEYKHANLNFSTSFIQENLVVQDVKNAFEIFCKKNNMEHEFIHAEEYTVREILTKESRFADILIVASQAFYYVDDRGEPGEYLRSILQLAECPVIIIPEKYNFPEHVIFMYDGSASSVFAIKQFSYLFPEFSKADISIVMISESEGKNQIEEENVRELLEKRFSSVVFDRLQFDPRKYFTTWLSGKTKSIVVSGSYGRTSFSHFFKRSFVADVIEDQQLPVFIAHP